MIESKSLCNSSMNVSYMLKDKTFDKLNLAAYFIYLFIFLSKEKFMNWAAPLTSRISENST